MISSRFSNNFGRFPRQPLTIHSVAFSVNGRREDFSNYFRTFSRSLPPTRTGPRGPVWHHPTPNVNSEQEGYSKCLWADTQGGRAIIDLDLGSRWTMSIDDRDGRFHATQSARSITVRLPQSRAPWRSCRVRDSPPQGRCAARDRRSESLIAIPQRHPRSESRISPAKESRRRSRDGGSVHPLGVEPRTCRLRVCCSAS